MYYEAEIEVNSEEAQMNLQSENDADSEFNIQTSSSTLNKVLSVLKPEFSPDEPDENPEAYAQKLKQQGYGAFYTSKTNIEDLVNLYANTKPKDSFSFPGLESPRLDNEIIFIETIKHFSGVLNEQIIEDKTVEFRYRGEI